MQEGTPEAVCRSPNSAFVMNFLGDANRIRATVANGKAELGGTALEAASFADGPAERLSASARSRLVGDRAWHRRDRHPRHRQAGRPPHPGQDRR